MAVVVPVLLLAPNCAALCKGIVHIVGGYGRLYCPVQNINGHKVSPFGFSL
jgi:hypothetical protein